MYIEWANDGETGELYIVQARPETVQAQSSATTFRHYRLKSKGAALTTGAAIGTAIAAGKACVIRPAAALEPIGRASCRERVGQYVSVSVVAVSLKKTKKNDKVGQQ